MQQNTAGFPAGPEPGPSGPSGASAPEDPSRLLSLAARGDESAFERLYDVEAAAVYGLIRRVLRDPAQSEEVFQEAFVEVWRRAERYEPSRGSAHAWIMMLAHRRAVDRVRTEQAGTDREARAGAQQAAPPPYDEVEEEAQARLEHERVRRCLGSLTERQRESITLAYYSGHSYSEVAHLLSASLGTIKSRIRDGLIRLRDCLGVDR